MLVKLVLSFPLHIFTYAMKYQLVILLWSKDFDEFALIITNRTRQEVLTTTEATYLVATRSHYTIDSICITYNTLHRVQNKVQN